MWQAFWHNKYHRQKKIDTIEKGLCLLYYNILSISLYLSLSSSFVVGYISGEDIEVLIYVFIIIETVQVEFY